MKRSFPEELLASYRKQFAYYRQLGEKTTAQLSFEQLTADDESGSNSIAVIVKHLHGNMLSRWTDFLTSDGEKEWRDRDREFIDDFTDRDALDSAWRQGWRVLEDALNGLEPDQLGQIVYIRNDGHTVAEAINRQLAHYAYHVGQIVLLGKQLRGRDWEWLSVPPGESEAYNAKKFSEERGRRHFTDDLIR